MLSSIEIQRRMAAFERPRWGYRRGEDGEVEKDLFDTDLPEGWVDTPAKVDGAGEPDPEAEIPDVGKNEENGASELGEVVGVVPVKPDPAAVTPPYDDRYNFPELRSELMRRTGKGCRPGTSRVELVAMLERTDSNQGEI